MARSSRRTFLKHSASGASLPLLSVVGCATSGPIEPTPKGTAGKALSAEDWSLAQAVYEHLLPAEPGDDTGPSANDINATGYLDAILAHPELTAATDAAFRDGFAGLRARVAAQYGTRPFERLDEAARETTLRAFEKTKAGDSFLHQMLRFLMEATLSDPVHGGNTEARGWTWLGHRPGWPQPTSSVPPRPRPGQLKVLANTDDPHPGGAQ